MARTQRTPKFPIGSKISKLFYGRKKPYTGTITSYCQESGYYHIDYDSDSDNEDMDEDTVRVYYLGPPNAVNKSTNTENGRKKPVKREKSNKKQPLATSKPNTTETKANSPKSMPSSQSTTPVTNNTSPKENGLSLLGTKVIRHKVESNGREIILVGAIASYFNAIQKYRVLYTNGEIEDLSYDEVQVLIEQTKNQVKKEVESLPLEEIEVENVKNEPDHTNLSMKRPNLSPRNAAEHPNASPRNSTDTSPRSFVDLSFSPQNKTDLTNSSPRNTTDRTTSSPRNIDNSQSSSPVNWVRNILFIVTSENCDGQYMISKRIIQVLADPTVKSKHAISSFVTQGGLVSLSKILDSYMNVNSMRSRILLILKVLAVMPNITVGYVSESNIGKKLKTIKKTYANSDEELSDTAAWVINHWLAQWNRQANQKSAEEKVKNHTISKAGSTKVESPRDGQSPRNKILDKGKPINLKRPQRSNSVNHDHYQSLMGVRKKTKIGPAYAYRSQRSTVLLDQLSQRAQQKQGNSEANDVRIPRIKFGNSDYLLFDREREADKVLLNLSVAAKTAIAKRTRLNRPIRSILRLQGTPPAPMNSLYTIDATDDDETIEKKVSELVFSNTKMNKAIGSNEDDTVVDVKTVNIAYSPRIDGKHASDKGDFERRRKTGDISVRSEGKLDIQIEKKSPVNEINGGVECVDLSDIVVEDVEMVDVSADTDENVELHNVTISNDNDYNVSMRVCDESSNKENEITLENRTTHISATQSHIDLIASNEGTGMQYSNNTDSSMNHPFKDTHMNATIQATEAVVLSRDNQSYDINDQSATTNPENLIKEESIHIMHSPPISNTYTSNPTTVS